MVFMLLPVSSLCQEYFEWRIAHESWVGRDKAVHFAGSGLLCICLTKSYGMRKAMIITSTAGLIWEIKDTCVPYEKAGDWGGQGFSYSDYIVGNAGILFSALIMSKIRTRKERATKRIPDELKINVVQVK